MLARATCILRAGNWPLDQESACVTLDYDDRHRRRIRLQTDDGGAVQLDLNEATRLADGDGLLLDSGGYVRVVAAPEAVADIRCHGLIETARMAWHVGNRHIPIQVLENGALRIRKDHVIVEMAERLGGHVTLLDAPFSPEPGAYTEPSPEAPHAYETLHEHSGHGHDHGY